MFYQRDKLYDKNADALYIPTSCSGRNKQISEFNVTQEYIEQYKDKPACITLEQVDDIFYRHDLIVELLKNKYSPTQKFQIIWNDIVKWVDKDCDQINRQIITFNNGYMMDIMCDSTEHTMSPLAAERLDLKLNDTLIQNVELIIPSMDAKRDMKFEKEISKIFKDNTIVYENEEASIGLVCSQNGELYVKDFILNNVEQIENMDLHYGEGFETFHKKLIERISKGTKGLVLLHGVPGTGKTYYIRQLIKDLCHKNILYFPASMVESIIDPGFVNFIYSWATENDEKTGIILIEDAEPLLESRDGSGRNMGITNLLNLSDGLLNNILNIQIIATFNIELTKIDSALLRKERLIARKEFGALDKDTSWKLCDHLKISKEEFEKMSKDKGNDNLTLADIYSSKKDSDILTHNIVQKKKKVGFNKD